MGRDTACTFPTACALLSADHDERGLGLLEVEDGALVGDLEPFLAVLRLE